MLLGAAPDPDTVLARVREYATGYSGSLQNFICTKTTVRSADKSGKGADWKMVDTREQELTYLSRKETYRLLRVNGAPPSLANRTTPGYTTVAGEFSTIAHVFHPQARAVFEWQGVDAASGGKTCVVSFRVAQDSGAGLMWTIGSKRVVLGYHGQVFADCESGAVTRLRVESDPSSEKNLHLEADIQYGPVRIGSKEYFLPLTATDISRIDKTSTRGEVRFTGYRKYDADSSVHFDGEP